MGHPRIMFCSRDIQVFVFLIIPWFTKPVTWWVLVHEAGTYRYIYLLNHNSLSHQTWPIDRYKWGKQFSGIFWTIWSTGAKFQVLFNLASFSNYSINDYVKIPVFHVFNKENKRHSKMVNIDYWKWPDLAILPF